jgi:hypothetical protein
MAFAFRAPPKGEHGEDQPPLVRLVGPVGGISDASMPGVPPAPVDLVWPTHWAPRIAPPGQALLIAQTTLADGKASDLGELTRVAALVRTAVRDLYADAAEQLAWERQWLRRDASADAFSLPTLAPGVPGVENLLLAGAEVSAPGTLASGGTAAALSGRAAADRVLAATTA